MLTTGSVSRSGERSRGTAPVWRRRRDLFPALAFILPATLGFAVFYVWPAVRGFYYSLTDYSLLGPAQFVGLDNYEQMIDDRLFWNALLVTAEYVAINIGTQTVLALLLAVLMQRLTRSLAIRGILILPYLDRECGRRASSGTRCSTRRSAW